MQNISNGTLIIHTPARTYCFGEHQELHGEPIEEPQNALAPVAELTVRNPNFWLRLCGMGDLGFAEAFMYGEVDCEDLVKVFLVRAALFCRLLSLDLNTCRLVPYLSMLHRPLAARRSS